jgi:threo-3-hydroxy-L-aspartate ammonia-lyase
MSVVQFADIQKAREILAGHATKTPIITSSVLNDLVGAEVFLKCENLQLVGAFKFRGAFNAISQLSDDEKKRGVIAFSSGNHAQGIALAGRMLGVKTVVVMPNNAPQIKVDATRNYGAEVIIYDVQTQDRELVAKELGDKHGYTTIPPYNHPHIIAGQGTAALELIESVGHLDVVMTCVGGGGLLSGTAIATKGKLPNALVVGVEPELANDAYLSFKTKQLHTIHNPPTIADGTRTPSLGSITFPLVLEYVDDMVTVSEEAIKEAVRFAFYHLKLVFEPSGALGLAALVSGAYKPKGRVGVVVSGGNIDGNVMADILLGR